MRKPDAGAALLEGDLQAYQRASALASIAGLLAELDGGARRALDGLPLDPSVFTDPERNAPYLGATRILANRAAETGCADFGLMMGDRMEPRVRSGGPLDRRRARRADCAQRFSVATKHEFSSGNLLPAPRNARLIPRLWRLRRRGDGSRSGLCGGHGGGFQRPAACNGGAIRRQNCGFRSAGPKNRRNGVSSDENRHDGWPCRSAKGQDVRHKSPYGPLIATQPDASPS